MEVGSRFGRLTVLKNIRRYGRYNYYVLCSCRCGTSKFRVIRFSLLNGETKSCGCYQRNDLARRSRGNVHGVTHGATKGTAPAAMTRTYGSWKAMIQRCTNPKANKGRDWHRYGGATPPVKVCTRWRVFSNFLADKGLRPEGTTLGRHRDRGDYTNMPGRCSWQTPAEQGAERRAHDND